MSNNPPTTEAARVISAAQLGGIRLVRASCQLDVESLERVDSDVEITYGFGGRIGRRQGEKDFTALAEIEATVASSDHAGADAIVRIEATYELSYALPEELVPADAELSAFAEVNAVFNAWPYFREFLQNITGRMLVPPVILPLFRIARPERAADAAAGPEQRAAEAPPPPATRKAGRTVHRKRPRNV